MGDRALVQFESGKEVSPVVYLHWNGTEVKDWLGIWSDLMKDRKGDVPYACARFIGVCHERIKGNTSLGVWNGESRLKGEDSHGDAGCFVVNCDTFRVEAFGGYGESTDL